MTDTSTEAVEAFIQSTMKEAVLSEGMPRTEDDTQDAYATVTLLRALTAERDTLKDQNREQALKYLSDAGQWCDLTDERDALRAENDRLRGLFRRISWVLSPERSETEAVSYNFARAAIIAATLAALSACSTTTTPEIEAAFARSDWPAIDRPHDVPINPRPFRVFSDQGGAFEIDMIRGEISPL